MEPHRQRAFGRTGGCLPQSNRAMMECTEKRQKFSDNVPCFAFGCVL